MWYRATRILTFSAAWACATGCGGSAASPGLTSSRTAGSGAAGTGGGQGGAQGQGGGLLIGTGGQGGGTTGSQGFAAQIEQNGVAVQRITVTCGGCADLDAVAVGGNPPYTFAWDDGSTTPARHVCPNTNTSYQVSVTDTGITSGEFQTPPQTVVAALTATFVPCSPPAPIDAGSGGALGTTVYWTNWSSFTAGTPGSAAGALSPPGGDVQVTFSGEVEAQSETDTDATSDFAPPTTYTSASVTDGPPNGGMVAISGNAKLTQTITFSVPVRDPMIGVWSIGFGSLGLAAVWAFDQIPSVLSSGPSTSWPFATPITVSGKQMTATEGNGVIQFTGTFTTISFTIPTPEPAPGFGGVTVGIRGRG